MPCRTIDVKQNESVNPSVPQADAEERRWRAKGAVAALQARVCNRSGKT